MPDFLSARLQMAVSFFFHIIFACIGMVMPFLMVASHYKWLKTREPLYYSMTRAWSKGVAILFATGAVSGTVLSFELGLLWPVFMQHAGPIFGMPFSLEGTAFFIEGIAIGLYLYGWDKMPERAHWYSAWLVGIAGVSSGIFVTAANSWMNAPSGFDWVNGHAVNIDPIKALFNKSWFSEALHMTIAAFEAVGFAVAGIHAYFLLRHPRHAFHTKALSIAIWFAAIAAILQPLSGDYCGKNIARLQPLKLAAAEENFKTQAYAPLNFGPVHLPGLLSFLAFSRLDATVQGLEDFPRELWPPVAVVHTAFDLMVACGSWLVLVGLIFLISVGLRKDILSRRWFLKMLAVSLPLGFVAVEAGWTVTETGRQPWIIYGILKTRDALTPMPGLIVPFTLITLVYILLTVVVTWLMIRQFKAVTKDK